MFIYVLITYWFISATFSINKKTDIHEIMKQLALAE